MIEMIEMYVDKNVVIQSLSAAKHFSEANQVMEGDSFNIIMLISYVSGIMSCFNLPSLIPRFGMNAIIT